MSQSTPTAAPDRPLPPPDAWGGLRTLIGTRLLVAVVAVPVGVLLSPGPAVPTWWVLLDSLVGLGLLSAVYALGVRLRRGLGVQIAFQLGCDLVLVSALAAVTGGRGSQFGLFYVLVVVTGGLLGRIPGGLLSAAGAAVAFVSLPWITATLEPASAAAQWEASTPPLVIVSFLGVLGILAGTLGERVHRTRRQLERTARELDRVRVDNDTVLRHLTTGVLTVDGHGVVGYLNPAAEQVLGVRSLECRGAAVQTALPERLGPLAGMVRDTLARRQPRARAELTVTNAAGRVLPIGLSTNLLVHEGRLTGVVAVFQDLTDVREMERRARRHETLAEIGALSARIAHELRNGLNPISGSVECLQRELHLTGENAQLMELVGRECARLNRFVSDLLHYSRERDLAVEPMAMGDHLAELCESLQHDPRRPAGVTVECVPPDGESFVRADREQLRQVWLNLAANAFEAMPRGGRLSIRQRADDGRHVIVEFQDTGAGIAADDLPRVGQPFFTTKQGGTGLGLAIAMRIVERHGGTLVLESVPGSGTTARVALPGDEAVLRRAA